MSDGVLRAGWRRSGLIGAGAAVPVVCAVLALAGEVSDVDHYGYVAFLGYGPWVVVGCAMAGLVAVLMVDVSAERLPISWLVPAPFVMWVVLLAGALMSGPAGSATERRLGWSLVVVAMYAAAGVVCGRKVTRRERILGAVVLVVAAPLMVTFDGVSQFRWRAAMYASAPLVLPVIPGYTAVRARGDGPQLDVDMKGPETLWVSVRRCEDRIAQDRRPDVWTVTDGRFELRITGPQEEWSPPAGISLRPASTDELASLPLAGSRTASD